MRRAAAGLAALVLCGSGVVAQSELVIILESAQAEKSYHRPGCSLVRDGKGVLALGRGEAESRGYTPHRECDPAFEAKAGPPTGAAAKTAKAAKPAPPEIVFVDTAGTHYHRKECVKLAKDRKPIAVTAVGKRWPCPVCRPPTAKRATKPVVPRWRG